jgi:hypothetical protein
VIGASMVDWAALIKVVYVSLLAGLGIVMVFTLAVIGVTRFSENRRAGRAAVAGGYALLGLLASGATGGAVLLGLIYMTQK